MRAPQWHSSSLVGPGFKLVQTGSQACASSLWGFSHRGEHATAPPARAPNTRDDAPQLLEVSGGHHILGSASKPRAEGYRQESMHVGTYRGKPPSNELSVLLCLQSPV